MGKPIELTLAYGQSWMFRNSKNGHFKLPPYDPESVQMLNDGLGVSGAGGLELSGLEQTDLIPATEITDNEQSVLLPFMIRRADRNPDALIVGRSEAVPGAALDLLQENPDSQFERQHGFANLVAVLEQMRTIADKRGVTLTVPQILWAQGAGNPKTDYRQYLKDVGQLFDSLSDEVLMQTGQEHRPAFVIVQAPGNTGKSRWPCLQATVDLCDTRQDCILATSGWAISQHDKTHFSAEGAVIAGQHCEEAAHLFHTGQTSAVPALRNFSRDGKWIEMDISEDNRICVDTKHHSPRHRLGDEPLPFYGFEAEGAEIVRVQVLPNRVKVLLDQEDGDVVLSFAAHNKSDRWKMAGVHTNQSANRGAIRSTRSEKNAFTGRPAYQWLASAVQRFKGDIALPP